MERFRNWGGVEFVDFSIKNQQHFFFLLMDDPSECAFEDSFSFSAAIKRLENVI